MVQTLGDDFPFFATVKNLAPEFNRGKGSTDDNPRSGRPKISATNEQVDAIYLIVLNDKRITAQQIAKSIDIVLVRSILL